MSAFGPYTVVVYSELGGSGCEGLDFEGARHVGCR